MALHPLIAGRAFDETVASSLTTKSSNRVACIVTRLFRRVVEHESGCWLWTGAADSHGYGHIRVNSRMVGVHIVSHALFCGPIRKGLFVCHKCDTPLCFNPEHLFLGTPADNYMDMVKKGRAVHISDPGRAKRYEAFGKSLTLKEWASLLCVHKTALKYRLRFDLPEVAFSYGRHEKQYRERVNGVLVRT